MGMPPIAGNFTLAGRGMSEPWTVSLVKLGARWSVILQGPSDSTRSISLTAEDGGLAPAIRRAIRAEDGAVPSSPAGGMAAASSEAPALAQDSHVCEHCHGALLVSYETRPAEPKDLVPAACPHCWKLNHFEVGAWAAAGRAAAPRPHAARETSARAPCGSPCWTSARQTAAMGASIPAHRFIVFNSSRPHAFK